MAKYIDAEKLAKAIEDKGLNCSFALKIERLDTLALIDELQQEQPEVDLVAELKHHLATTPKEQLEKEWKELEHWNNIGPTVQEFLYGKQPEVDLEKFISDFIDKKDSENQGRWYEEDIIEAMKSSFALGLNARKV